MTNNEELAMQAESIIADMKLKHGQNDFYAPVMTWAEFSILWAERDADKKQISEQRDYINALEARLKQVSNARDELDRDVDAANARVDTKCAQLCNQDEEIEMLRLRIAELEASHQKLRESMAAIHNTIRMDGVSAPLEAIMGTAKRAYVESAADAGIKLEVGE